MASTLRALAEQRVLLLQAGRKRPNIVRINRNGAAVRTYCLHKPSPSHEQQQHRVPLERASALALSLERPTDLDILGPISSVSVGAPPRLRIAVDVDEGEQQIRQQHGGWRRLGCSWLRQSS